MALHLRRSILMLVMTVIAAVLTVAGTSSPSVASHFRANQLTWQKVSGTTVDFTATGSWRCTYYAADPCDLTVGSTFYPAELYFGDGGVSMDPWTVTNVDVANDVVSAELEVQHTFTSNGPFTASISGCCRLSSPNHVNNPDGDLLVQSLVDLGATTASPVSSISPIVDCPISALCQFTVPAFDPDGQSLTYRLATADEAGSGLFDQPGPPTATNTAAINPTSGLYTWDTSGATLSADGSTFYSTQVIVENRVSGTVVSTTAVDFFIRLGSNSTNQQPIFTTPTPADGSTLTAYVGQPFTFSAAAMDPDAADTVTLAMLGKPAAATYTGTPANPTSATFSWTPTATGTVLLTLTAQDQSGLGAVARSVTINVSNAPPNDPPTAVDDAGTTAEDNPLVTSVLSNDTDPNSDALTVTSASPTAAHGTVSCTATQCSYTPAANYVGTDSYDYTISDGKGGTDTGTVSVTITAVNDAPNAVNDTATTAEENSILISVLSNDTDAEGNTLTITTAAPTASNGTVSCTSTQCTYTPTTNFTGTSSFTYGITDGNGGTDTATVTVTVTPVNDTPNAVDDAASTTTGTAKAVNVLANDTDIDGDTLSVTGKTNGTNGGVTCSATTCTYTPTAGFIGTDTFTYTVSDGKGGTDTAKVTMTVTAATATPNADVSITKTALVSPVPVGDASGWTLVIRNNSATQTALSVQVSDTLPAGFMVRDDDSSSCTTTGSIFQCNLGNLAPGATRTVNIYGAFTRSGTSSNTATVTSSNDTSAGNNSATASANATGQTCTIVGTFGDDRLLGTNSNDVICGLSGDDRITAKQGDDTVYGNEGDDFIQGLGGDDYIDGGLGQDRTLYSALRQAVRVDLGRNRSTGQGTDSLISIEDVTGSSKADVVVGNAAANSITGGAGNDNIDGAAGNDNLKGSAGKDKLKGGAGKDNLAGGAGQDSLKGGGGKDTCSGTGGTDTAASC